MKLPANRWRIAGLALVGIAALFAWQQHRLRLVTACTSTGGLWDGRASKCLPARQSPILQRDLRRT